MYKIHHAAKSLYSVSLDRLIYYVGIHKSKRERDRARERKRARQRQKEEEEEIE